MKHNFNVKRALALVTVLLLLVTLFVACDPIGGGGSGTTEVFTPPSESNTDNSGGSIPSDNKLTLTGEQAMGMVIDSMNRSIELNQFDATVLNFEFETFLDLNEALVQQYYAIQVKGSIDLNDDTKSLLSVEIISQRTGVEDKLIFGAYAMNGSIYLDLRNSYKGEGVHVFKADNINLAWFTKNFQAILKQLDLGGFMEDFKLGELVDLSSVESILGAIGLNLSGSIPEILTSIIAESYAVDRGDGVTSIIMPTKLNNLIGMLGGVVGALLTDDIYELVDLIFGWDVAGIMANLGKGVTAGIFLRCDIKDGVFKKMSLGVVVEDDNSLDIDVGMKDIVLGKKPTFNLPDFTGVETEDYSFTRLNLDLIVEINATQHTYNIAGIDTAFGQLISGLIGDNFSFVDANGNPLGLGATEINIVDDTVFRLQLKLRADIDLKDNDNTEILLEILGGETQDVRAGIYYIGKNDALYIDLSGMGGGRYMIDSYSREVAEEDPNGRFVRNYYFEKALIGGDYVLEEGEYVEYDEEFHADMDRYNKEYEYAYYNPVTDADKTRYSVEFVQSPLDLGEIIRTAIEELVPKIPSLMSLIVGDGAAAVAEDENYETVKALLDSGEVLIEHYSTAESAADGELDILGLIKKILLCATITRGETKMSFDTIMISLTDDVIATILDAISPGLSLPITKLDVLIDSSTGLGLDGLIITAALGDTESDVQAERELLTLGVSLLTDYGNAKDDYIMPDVNSVAYMRVPLSKDELGNMTGLTDINLSLNGAFRLQANQGTWDLSPLEEVLLGLVLQLDVQEDIDMYYGFDIQANLNLAGLTAGDDILGAIEARIELTKNPGANSLPTIIVVLSGGKLYIDATKIGIPKIMLDINEITEGNVKLFGGAAGVNALSVADGDDEGMSTEEILALIAGLISGVNIDSNNIEVALATNLLGAVIGLINPELADNEAIVSVLPQVSDGSGIAIHLDGLNLSELYIDVNIGLESNENQLDLGLGLGHIGFGLNKLDLMPADVNEYYDLLADLNIYLGIQGSLVIELAEGEIDLNNIIGALLVDMTSNVDNEFKPKINVEEDILAGIDINIQASVDLKNAPENNNTQLVVELRGTRTGKLLLGAYYEYGKLYVDGSGLAISKFVIEDLDLIKIIKDLIDKPDDSSAQAAADIDLSGLEAALILSKNGLKVKVLGGLTAFILNLIVGDTFSSIDGVYKYILESEATDAQKQTAVEFVPAVYDTFIKNGYILLTDSNAAAYAGKPVYNKVIDENLTGGFGYVAEGTAAADAALEKTGDVVNKYVLDAETEYTKITSENEAQFVDKVRFIKVGDTYIVESGASAEQIAQAAGYRAESYAVYAKSDAGFVLITSENSEMFATADKYIKYAMTEEELSVLDVLANEGMAGFDLPEIGAEVDINLGKGSGKPLLNALSINVLATIGKDLTLDPAVSIAIRLGDIDIGVGMRDIVGASNIDKSAFASVSLFDADGNFSRLDLFVEIIGALEVGAFAADPEVMNYSLGNAISQFADLLGASRETDDNGNELFDANGNAIIKDNTAIYNLLCAIMIKFNVVNDLSDVTGFRIAGNVALGSLFGDAEDKITPLLAESELLIEIYNDAYGKGKKLIGLYLKDGFIYIHLAGNILANSKLKIDLVGSGLLSGLGSSASAASNALETAVGSATASMSVRDIGGLINGLVSKINITNDSISINLGANLIGAVLGLVLDGSGYNIPILNEENSFVSWGATDQNIFGEGVKCLKISLGIDPVFFSIALGGFRFSLAHEDILPADVIDGSEYKSITELTNISLSVDIGIDLKLKEGVLPVGDIISTIAPLLGTDLDFGMDINIEDDIEYNLRLYLRANLNVADLNNTEIFLELWNEPASGDKKKVLGVYLVPEPVPASDEVNPTLYVDSEVLNIAKFMMEDFDILSALLQEDVSALMKQLNDLLGGSGDGAAAADGLTEQQTIDILFDLSAHNLKIVLTESIILGLLTSLAPDVITPEIMQIIDDLNLQAAVAINTVPFELKVTVDTDYLALGVFVAEPMLSIEPIQDLFKVALANKEQYINYNNFQCLSAEIELAIKYHLYGTEGKDLDLSTILKDLTGLDALQGDDKATIRNILNAVALKVRLNEIEGEIVINIVANILLGDLMETPEVGENGNWWIYGQDMGVKAKFGTESNRPTAGDDGYYYVDGVKTDVKKKTADIWKMLEAGIFISFDNGSKTVVVSLKDGILYVKLDDIGGPNISFNLMDIINNDEGSGTANALSTDATAAADLNLNDLLNNIVNDIVIQKGYGLDITIAPQILSALINSLAPGLLSDESLQHLMLVDEVTDDSAFAEEGTTLTSEYLDNRPYAKIKVADDTYNYKLVSKLVEGDLVYVGPGFEAYTEELVFSNFYKIRHSGISYRKNDLSNGGRKSLNIDIAFKNGFDLGISIRGYSIGAQQATVLPLATSEYISLSRITGEDANDKLFVSTTVYLDFAGENSTVELGELLQEVMYVLADSTKVDEKYNYISIGNQLAELVRPTINIADFENKLEIQVAAALDLNALINEKDTWDKLKTSDIAIKIVNPKLTGVESVILGLFLSDGMLYVQRRTESAAEPRYIKYDISSFIGSGSAVATNSLATADAVEEPSLILICEEGAIKIELTTPLVEKLLSVLLGANLDFSGNLEEVNGEIVLKWSDDGKAFDLNDFGLDIGINLNTLHIGLGIKDLRLGIADDAHVAVPAEVKTEAVALEELVLDLGLDVGIGLDINDINLITLLRNFGVAGLDDLDDYADKLTIYTDDNPGAEGAYFGLLVSVKASLNLSDIDKTSAKIDIKAQLGNEADDVMKTIIGVSLVDGVVYADLSTLFGEHAKLKILGVKLSTLLGIEKDGSASIADLISALSSSDASAAVNEENKTSLDFNSDSIVVYIGSALIDLILEIVGANVTLPAIRGALTIQYLNSDGKLDLEIRLDAEMLEKLDSGIGSKLLGAQVYINNINFHLRNNDAAAEGELVAKPSDADTAYAAALELGIVDGKVGIKEILLDKITLGLELNLNSMMNGDGDNEMDITGFIAPLLSAIDYAGMQMYDEDGNPIETIARQLALRINAEVGLDGLIEAISSGDILANLGGLLMDINLAVELVKTYNIDGAGWAEEEVILGIYVYEGDAYIYLGGLGLPNIRISNEFLINILGALGLGSATANSLETADAVADTGEIIAIIAGVVNKVTLAEKALTITLANDFIFPLLQTLVPDIILPEYTGVFPEFGKLSDGTEGNKIALNLGAFTSSTPTGLLAIDLQFYGLNVGVDLYPPVLGCYDDNVLLANDDRIQLPLDADSDEWVYFSNTSTELNVSLTLAGSLGLTQGTNIDAEGVCTTVLGDVIGNLVGDLSTKLIMKDDVIIDFEISASLKVIIDLTSETPAKIGTIDLAVNLLREGKLILGIFYDGAAKTAYIDASHLFANADGNVENIGSNATGKLAIKGLDLVGLISGALATSSATADGENALLTASVSTEPNDPNYGTLLASSAIWAEFGPNTMLVTITGALVNAIINRAAPDAGVEAYLPKLAVQLNAGLNPMFLNIDVDVLDDNYDKAFGIQIGLKGFDYDDFNPGSSSSDLVISGDDYANVSVIGGMDFSDYRTLLTLDLDKLTGGDIAGGLKFENDVLNVSLGVKIGFDANNTTGENGEDWAKYLAKLFGLDEDEFMVLIDILGFSDGASNSELKLTIDAAINLGGLLNGFDLTGTEARITLETYSDITSNELHPNGEPVKIVITLIGNEGNGMSGIYLDLSGYRGKGKHRLSLDLIGLISGSGSATAVNTGMLGEQLFNILDGLLDSVVLADGAINVNLKRNALDSLFNLLLPEMNITDTPPINGGVSIDLRNLNIGVLLGFGELDELGDYTMTKAITIGVGYISLAKPDGYAPNKDGKCSFIYDTSEYYDLTELQLNVDLLGELTYTGIRSSSTNPPIDLSAIFELIKIDGKPLVENPLFQLRIAADMGTTFTINTHIFFDLADFSTLKISFEVVDTNLEGDPIMIGAYLDGENLYIDLTSLGLPKLALDGINLADILEGALGGFLGHEAKGSAVSNALATSSDEGGFGNVLLSNNPLPYVALVFRPEAFAIGINAAFIDTIINLVKRSQGEDVEVGARMLPDFGDIAIVGDSRTFYTPVNEASEAEKINIRERYVLIDGEYVIYDAAVHGAKTDSELYIKIGGKLLPELAIKISDGFFGSVKLNDVHINGNYAKIHNVDIADDDAVGWQTANSVFRDRVEGVKFQSVYNLKTGELGLDKINVGLDICLRFMNINPTSAEDYSNSFQYYFSALVNSLLGTDDSTISNFKLNVPTGTVGYILTVKLSTNISQLITDTGFDIGGLLNSEIFIELHIDGDFENTLILGLYKQANDPAVYADLSGLGLPKVKIIGLSTLLAGIGSAVSAVVDAASAAAAGDASAASAFAEVVLENGRIELALNMDFLLSILGLLDLEMSSKTYSDGVHTKTFKTIIIRDEVTKVVKMEIPLPDVQDIKLSLDIARKLDSITLEVGLDSIGNTVQLAIENITISTDDNFFTNEFNSLQGDNADDWAALILTDINGVSLTNILKNVLDGLDPTIIISLNKKVQCKVTDTGSLTSNYTPTYTSLVITRTNGDANQSVTTSKGDTINVGKNSGGDEVYGGKLSVNILIDHNESSVNGDRSVAVWLFNNALFGDLRGLSWLTSGIGALGKLRFTDLNIINLVAGASSAEAESIALATAEEESSVLNTIKGYISGIEIDWWFNTQYPGTYGEQRYTNIRVNLNPVGINDLLYYVYYLLYSLTWSEDANGNKIAPDGCATVEQFKALTHAQKAEIVLNDAGTSTSSGYNATDCYRKIPYYLQQMLVNLVKDLIGGTGGNLVGGLIDGEGGIGAILVEIITGLLPIPLLDETGTYESYALITLDKDNTDGSGKPCGIIKEIGLYINREKVRNDGSNNLVKTDVNDDGRESAEITISLNGLFMRAVESVQWYNDEEKNFGASVGITNIGEEDFVATKSFVVADPFNPVELSSAALGNASALPQRVDATFTGITAYTSKGQNGQTKTDEWVELGGTSIIWDVSQVNLVPGSRDSYIYGYALNKQVIKIPVIVGNNTGYMQVYGYLDANGEFVKSDSLTIDTTKPGGLTELPKTIVIQQNNGELRMISSDYKAAVYEMDAEGNPTTIIKTPASPSATVDGTILYAVGQMGWISPDADVLNMGGNVDNKFWYKINNSAKITVSTKVEYVNSNAVKGYLPAGAAFDVLAGGDALDIDSASLNITENIGALNKVNVEYSNGEIREVEVKTWKFDKLKYNINAPYEGVSGYATAVITTYGTNGAQDVEVKVPVSARASVVKGLTEDSISFSQYTSFTKETLLPDDIVNLDFTLSRITSETRAVSRDEITLFNDDESRTLVLPDGISVSSDTTITVKAAIGERGVNEQIFKVSVVIKPKTIQAAYCTVYSDRAVVDITTMKVLYTDGTVETLDILDRGNLDELTLEAGGVYPIAISVGKTGAAYSKFTQSVTATIRVRRTASLSSSASAASVIPTYVPEVMMFAEEGSAAADEITLTEAEILGGNDVLVFDPLFDNLEGGELPYPETVDAVIDGGTVTLTLVKADYNGIVSLEAIPNADDTSITSVTGGVYTEAVFEFKDVNDKQYFINVPVYVIDRQIKKCNLPTSFTVNPFTFDANPLSAKFSFVYRQAMLTFTDDTTELVDIVWSNTDGSQIALPSGFSAKDGATGLKVRAKCGTGLAGVSREIGYELKKVRLASYGVSDDVKALVQNTAFTAYPESNDESARYYGNFPTSVKTGNAYLGGVTLELKWKLETLKYSYMGGETYVEVDVGNTTCGYQTMQIPVTVAACEIESVAITGLDLSDLLGLDPYTYSFNADIKDKILSEGVNFVVTYANGKTRALTNNGVDVVWNFSKINPVVVCAAGGNTFSAEAILFNTEYAGGQTYSVPVTFIRREMQAIYSGTALLTDTTVLNPYDYSTDLPTTVSAQFKKYSTDGTEAGVETLSFTGSELVWNTANFRPETSGDRCTKICTLVKNGASYSVPISYEVTPYEAATISRWGDAAVSWVVEDGKIWAMDAENNLVAPYTINPLTATKDQHKPANTSITVTFNEMSFGNAIDGTWISGNKKFVIADGNYIYYLNNVETKSGAVDDNFKFIVNYDEYIFEAGAFTHTQYGETTDKVVMKGTYTVSGTTYTLNYGGGAVTKTLTDVTLDANNTFKAYKSIENVMIISGVGLGGGLRYAKQAVAKDGGVNYTKDFGYVDLKLPAGYKVSLQGGIYTANIRLGKGADLAMDVVVLDKSFTYTTLNIADTATAGSELNLPKAVSVTYNADGSTGNVPIYWVVTRNYIGSSTSTVEKQVYNADGTAYDGSIKRQASNTTEFVKTEVKQYYEAGATTGNFNVNQGNSGASYFTIVGYVGRVMDGSNVLLDTGVVINATINVGSYTNNLVDIAANGVWMSTDNTYTMLSFNRNNAKSVNIVTGACEGSSTSTTNITVNGTYSADGNIFTVDGATYYVTVTKELGEDVIKVTMIVNADGTVSSSGMNGNTITFKRVM